MDLKRWILLQFIVPFSEFRLKPPTEMYQIKSSLIFNNILGLALECWNCDGILCEDPFQKSERNNMQLWHCKKPQYSSYRDIGRPVCMKMSVFYELSNSTMTHRKCHVENEGSLKNSCESTRIDHGTVIFCETCTTDGCNAATMQEYSLWLSLSSLIMFNLVK